MTRCKNTLHWLLAVLLMFQLALCVCARAHFALVKEVGLIILTWKNHTNSFLAVCKTLLKNVTHLEIKTSRYSGEFVWCLTPSYLSAVVCDSNQHLANIGLHYHRQSWIHHRTLGLHKTFSPDKLNQISYEMLLFASVSYFMAGSLCSSLCPFCCHER